MDRPWKGLVGSALRFTATLRTTLRKFSRSGYDQFKGFIVGTFIPFMLVHTFYQDISQTSNIEIDAD